MIEGNFDVGIGNYKEIFLFNEKVYVGILIWILENLSNHYNENIVWKNNLIYSYISLILVQVLTYLEVLLFNVVEEMVRVNLHFERTGT